MYFKVSWDDEFDALMMHLWSKYGKEMFTVDGIGEQMDLHKFSKKFFNDATTTADASVDANANVSQRTSIEYNFEMPKPLRRYNSYFCLWKQLRKDFGLELANKIIEAQLNGEIYVNDFTDVNMPYSYHPDTFVTVRKPCGDEYEVCAMTLKQLYEECSSERVCEDWTEKNDTHGYQVLLAANGYDHKGDVWTPLTRCVKHISHTDCVTVRSIFGRSITVTTDHPFVMGDGYIIKAGEVSKGDSVPYNVMHGDFSYALSDAVVENENAVKSFIQDDVFYNSVVESVDRVPYIGEEVYDITTGCHYFSANGFLVHNCFNYSTNDIKYDGLKGLSSRPFVRPPKSLDTFIRQVEQFMVIAANSSLGASGFSDALIVASTYVDNMIETGKDGHINIGNNIDDIKTYVKEKLTEFIYTVNWPFRGNQCVTEDTDVLTPDGFKSIDNLSVGDSIYTWKDGKMNVQPVKRVNVYDYNGEMHEYRGRDVLQVVTPNHRVLYKTGSNPFTIKESRYVIGNKSPVEIPVALVNERPDFNISDDWIDFATFVLTDGSIDREEGRSPRIAWCKSPTRWGQEYFEELCDRLGLQFTKETRDSEWGGVVDVYRFNVENTARILPYVSSKSKLPSWMFELSARQAQRVVDIWGKTDGYMRDGKIKLQVDTTDVADDLQHICFLAGYGSRQTERVIGNNRVPTRYVIVYTRRVKSATSRNRVYYKGRVWCPTTDDGVVVFRKEGRIFISGNSPFSNLSVYDDTFLDHLCPDYGANKETVKLLQELYLDAMNDEMSRTPLTFPVTTACFCTDEDNNLKDKEFAKFIAEKNLKYGFINIYNGKTTNLSSCCFSGNTKVLTCDSNGVFFGSFKDLYDSPYSDHRKNFTVFHNGSWCRGKLIKLPSRPMYRVKTVTGKVLEVTDNHLHLTTRGDVSTTDLTTGDYLALNQRVLPEKRSTRRGLSYVQGYVIGLYAGDGSRYKRDGMNSWTVTFSLNNGKKVGAVDKIKKALREWGLDDTVSRFDDGKLMSIVVNSKEFYDITEEYVSGDYANTKSFTPNVFIESSDFRRGIKDGWYMSDGGNSQRIYSSSHDLIETGEALFTTLGIATRIDVSDRRGEVEIKGEVFTRNFPIYCIRWYEPNNKRSMDGVYVVRNNTMYVKIQSIEPMEYDDSHVYCFEMANEEEPYFTLPNGVITHNCRLRSSTDNPYFNTFGAGSTKIGSLGVVTVSFPRAAMKAVDKADASLDPELKEQYFMENLRDLFDMECMINSAKRKLISKRIELGAAPLYTHGYMALSKQYSTFGIVGLNEAVEIMGYDILTKEGQAFVSRVLDTINEWVLSAENQYKAPHNVEQVPSEGSAVKLATKDKMMGYDCGVPFYSNQFIPLVTQANMLDRIRLQGMFDAKMSGGAICHINVAEEITDPDKMVKLMEYAAKCGVVYWAVNYRIRMCENHHTWVGTDKCPVCGEPYTDEITRVVGFFTNTKHWNKTRREHDWPNRQFYSSI